eukprot:gene19274-25131_t
MSKTSAEKDEDGKEYLSEEPWQKMGTKTLSARASEYLEKVTNKVTGDLSGEDLIRVLWLSATLFFVVGGYWLLRSLKDPIMSVIDGVEYIPQAKIASLFVVFGLVIVYNKLLDILPKHQLFYLMGATYGVLFLIMGLLLLHPTIGLANTKSDPSRLLGWISYVTIESFGSMVVQAYWALVNASVDVHFAKKNFGLIVAGAQIGSILGPTVATQASVIGIPALYLGGSFVMFLMIGAMYLYVQRFGVPAEEENDKSIKKSSGKEEGIMEGFYLFYDHDYVKGIFCISSLFMINVTVIDYMMKVLAKERYATLHPNDPQLAIREFASFMGYFGQTTNSISFLFSLFVWIFPTIWVVFAVMMIIKGMSYALNNPTKEILYQATSTSIKFKCKSWIDTFGQRSAKATGSLITNAFATSVADLNNYGSIVGVAMSAFLIWISNYMGVEFERLQASNEKVGEKSKQAFVELSQKQNITSDTSCGVDEEGQGDLESSDLLVKKA